MDRSSISRFSDRVSNYVNYRPGYPQEVISTLKTDACLNEKSVVTDIGSGTGIFTKMLLAEGCNVYGVEPNKAMRAYAETNLQRFPKFISVDGSASQTGLPDGSCNLLVCAQAFHWFNNDASRQEFKRVLTANGFAALIWNNRQTRADDFAIAYDALLKEQSADYNEVNHQNLKEADFKRFFRNGEYKYFAYPNVQVFDYEGLSGRAFSSSYVPQQATAEGKTFEQKLQHIFDEYQSDGQVSIVYKTEVYLGHI